MKVLKECIRLKPDDATIPLLAAKLCMGSLHWVSGAGPSAHARDCHPLSCLGREKIVVIHPRHKSKAVQSPDLWPRPLASSGLIPKPKDLGESVCSWDTPGFSLSWESASVAEMVRQTWNSSSDTSCVHVTWD